MIEKLKAFFGFICQIFFAIYRDYLGIRIFLYTRKRLKEFSGSTVADEFRKLVKLHPNKKCIIYNDVVWTFQDVIFI